VVTFDAAAPGTSFDTWTTSALVESLPELDLGSIVGLAVVAAHPDDETLGAGGLIAELSRRDVPLRVVIVTDGGASNPASSIPASDVAAIRSAEGRAAVENLAPAAIVHELGCPDGRTSDNRDAIARALAASIPDGFVIATPWRGDGHRDHRIVGELCAALAIRRRAPLLEYPVWMWHWAEPGDPSIPWSEARAIPLPPEAREAKRAAIGRYESQVIGLGIEPADAPVLAEDFLAHFRRDRECFFVSDPVAEGPKTEAYFDDLYERNSDPWRLATRWYETRKRAISIASLPRPRFASALEIGCSVGELTALLADRADLLLALDISQAAVATAAARVSGIGNVRVEHRDATRDFPHERFDLIVLSEVAYYWDAATLRSVIDEAVDHLRPDGILLACHWRHPVADYPLGGDEVHAALAETGALHRIARHEEEDFLLEVFGIQDESVARREGLLG
jgi:LmbE family N-acetylglucosaminyl deacetylase/SAM-dependent methyltransferase